MIEYTVGDVSDNSSKDVKKASTGPSPKRPRTDGDLSDSKSQDDDNNVGDGKDSENASTEIVDDRDVAPTRPRIPIPADGVNYLAAFNQYHSVIRAHVEWLFDHAGPAHNLTWKAVCIGTPAMLS